jgi:hypothetical protein
MLNYNKIQFLYYNKIKIIYEDKLDYNIPINCIDFSLQYILQIYSILKMT